MPAHEFRAGAREQHLPAVSRGHDTLHACQGQIARISACACVHVAERRFASVDAHTDFDRSWVPRFTQEPTLRLQRGVERIARRVERHAKRVADDLKDLAMLCGNRFVQDGVMACERGRKCLRVAL